MHALTRRASRNRHSLFLAEGPQSVREAVRHRPDLVRDVYVTPEAGERYASVLADAAAAGLRLSAVSTEVLAAMADAQTPQGLLAVCRFPSATLAEVLAARPRLLSVLVQVRDPGNAGTVVRAADAAGADAVIVTEASVDIYAPKVVRSSAGSIFHLPVVSGVPAVRAADEIRMAGLRLLAADGSGERLLSDVDLRGPHAWFFGNEAWGLPDGDGVRWDEVVRIPIYGQAESLNLAMAATVCLYASASAAPH